MYIVLGATGNVGSVVADELLDKEGDVTIITHSHEKAADWAKKGAKTAIADVKDTDLLTSIFNTGKYLFLLNPPAPPDTDTDKEERLSVKSILKALVNTPIERIIAASTYGAQPGENIGNPGTLYDLEQGLKDLHIPYTIIRAAYYMSNWENSVASVTKENRLYTFFPPDYKLPMVAPEDIGKIAAALLTKEIEDTSVRHVEGPEHYSAADVANAFGKALGKPIGVKTIPEKDWIQTMRSIGFSEQAAASFAGMIKLLQYENPEIPASPFKGNTTLEKYIRTMIEHQQR